MPQQINLFTKINRASIRRETLEGRPHLVVSSYTLPANVVMNGVYYPAAEIDKHFNKLEGTLAPFGHPTQNGEFISANSAVAINGFHVGAWNRNVTKVGNRIHSEKWIDLEVANNSANGRRLVERLEAMMNGEESEPIHTSVALLIHQMKANAEQRKAGADHVAQIVDIDHDAILMDEVGAATPAQGVGMMVNVDLAMSPNASLIAGGAGLEGSYRNRERALDQAARERFPNPESAVWIADFSDDHVVIATDGETVQYEYTVENGKIVIGQEGTPVQRKESWVSNLSSLAARVKQLIFPNSQAFPPDNIKEGDDMPMTPEERATLIKEMSESLAPTIAANIETALKPVGDAVTALQESHKQMTETLTANQRAEETAMKEVVKAKYGEIVANSLKGEALIEMYKTCGTSATLAGNSGATGGDKGMLTADPQFLPKE